MYFNAVTLYRVGRWARSRHIPLLPAACMALLHLFFNSYIALSAEIGEGTFCAHRGISVVVGKNVKIGRDCTIRAGVVLGATRGARAGQPVIGDRVELGVGAKILGPVSIGDDAVIGANAVVLENVPAGGVAVGVPARLIRVIDPGRGDSGKPAE